MDILSFLYPSNHVFIEVSSSQYENFTNPLENFDLLLNNDILKYIPREFTLTTNNGSSQFNILLLSKTSKHIKNIISVDPTTVRYNLDINDESNTLKQIEQLYHGNIVNFDNYPNIQQISDILENDNLKKAISFKNITFSPHFLRKCFVNNKYKTFSIIFNDQIYKCNKYGVYISKIIRDFLSENPDSNEFEFDCKIEFDDIQPIIDFFNFSKVDTNDDNIYLIKELFDKFQITSISLNFLNEKIKENEKLNQAIDDQQTMIESIEEIFDLLYHINERTIESVKEKILQSTWITSEEDVEELAAIFLQVINNNYLLHPFLIDLLVELDNEKIKSKYLQNLFQIIKNKIIDSLGETKESCCFINHLFERNILSRDQTLYKINNVSMWFNFELSQKNELLKPLCLEDKIKFDNFQKMKYLVEPIDDIANALFHDNVDIFQSITTNSNIDISLGKVNYNMFDDFIPEKNIPYINYAAAYGSIKCFKYLLLNHVQIDSQTFEHAIWGGNIEIIKIISQNYKKINDNALIPAIIRHKNDLFTWIFDQMLSNKFSSQDSANKILSFCAYNGNIRLFFEIIDKEFQYSYKYINFIENASKTGFYKFARMIWNIFNHKITCYHVSSQCSFVSFNSISIFKLFLEIFKDRKDLQKCLKYAIKTNHLKLVKFFFDQYINESFKINGNFAFHLLKHSLRMKSSLTKYLINNFLNINPKVFHNFEFYHLISIACLNNDLESVKMIVDLKNKYSSIKDYTNEFIYTAKSNFFEICKYFFDSKLYVDFQIISAKANELENLRKDIFLLLFNNSDDETRFLLYQSFRSPAIKGNNIELAEFILENSNKCNYNDLINAVNTGDINMVKLIFKYDPNIASFINHSSNNGSPLFIAVKINNIEIVKTLLSIPEINMNVTSQKSCGDTILVHALRNNKFEIAKLLIQDKRTDINICQDKNSPLVIAVNKEETDIIDLLINNPKFDEKANLLDYAFYISNNRISKQLFSLKSLDVNYYYAPHNQTTLVNEVNNCNDEKIDLIINHSSFDKIKSNLTKAIIDSIKKNDINIFKKLLKLINNDVNIYVTNSIAKSSLFTFAIDQQREEIATEIFESPNFNPDQNTIQSSFEKLLEKNLSFDLLKKVVEYDEKNHHFIDFTKLLSNGKSIFTSMNSSTNFDEIVNFCIDHGADPNIQDLDGIDSLSYAIKINSVPYVLALINSKKIDLTKKILDQKTRVKKTYLHLAARLDEPEILIQLLEKKEIDVNAEDDNGETPLMESCRFNKDKIIEALFQIEDLDYLHVNKNGDDALKIVVKENNTQEKLTKNDYFKALMNQLFINKNQNSFDNEENNDIKIKSSSSDLERFDDVD